MESTWEVYKTIPDEGMAMEFAAILNDLGLEFTMEEFIRPEDPILPNVIQMPEYIFRLRPEDFAIVDTKLAEQTKNSAATDDHYLYAMSDEELLDVLKHPKQWSEGDYEMALRLAKERNIPLNMAKIEQEQQNEQANLRKAKDVARVWLILPFLIPVVVFKMRQLPMPLLFSFLALGLLIGVHFREQKKQLNGKYYYYYSRRVRRTGNILIWYMVIVCLLFVYYAWHNYRLF